MSECECGCGHGRIFMSLKMLILGIILIAVRKYTTWDIWIVLGALAVLIGLIHLVVPMCKGKKKRR